MQRYPPNESKITIPPNLLKNFNVYEMLEPQKNGANNSDATKVDKLIDIDDCSNDSGFQDLPASFLDKQRDFDLVDLYQNIYVTPQHIKKKDTACDDADISFTASKAFDAGLNHFLDVLESGEKTDWTKMGQSKEERHAEHDFVEEKPRVLVPKVFTEPDSDPEDLINEVLTQKNLEKLVIGNISNSPKFDSDSPKKTKITDIIPEFSRLNLKNSINKEPKFENASNVNEPRPSDIKTGPIDNQINNSLTNFNVRAIQKDDKVYKKRRIITPEHLKANYCKGPDFNEKSIVLPQIMARLNARLAYLGEKSNHKKRLILDTGSKSVKAECSTSNANEQVKRKHNQAECSTFKIEQVKKAPNIQTNMGIKSMKLDSTPIKKEAQLCINKQTQNIAVHTTDRPCANCSKSAKKATSTVAGNDFGKLSPVVLMEDCNKERLRALKQSQMFKDFVLKGKYEI